MGINIRQKGQEGERQIAKVLNGIIAAVRAEFGLEPYETRDELFQRNQNQSAVGGSDLSNPLGLEIEVKRQEQLSVNVWWKQCVESAERTGGIPILVFKQNRKPWRVCMFAELPLVSEPKRGEYVTMAKVRAEIDLPSFEQWFRQYYRRYVAV